MTKVSASLIIRKEHLLAYSQERINVMRITRKTRKNFALPHGAEYGVFMAENEEEIKAILEEINEMPPAHWLLSTPDIDMNVVKQLIVKEAKIKGNKIQFFLVGRAENHAFVDMNLSIPLSEVEVKIEVDDSIQSIDFYWGNSQLEIIPPYNWKPTHI